MIPGANLRVVSHDSYCMMGCHYQRAGTQYLLIAAHVLVGQYNAASHRGDPGKLLIVSTASSCIGSATHEAITQQVI